MKIIILLTLAASFMAKPEAVGGVMSTTVKGCMYVAVEANATFDESVAACQAEHASLVFIKTEAKKIEVADVIKGYNISTSAAQFWIGANKTGGSPSYQWGDGTIYEEVIHRAGDCIAIKQSTDGSGIQYEATNCNNPKGYICNACDAKLLPSSKRDEHIIIGTWAVISVFASVVVATAIIKACTTEPQAAGRGGDERTEMEQQAHTSETAVDYEDGSDDEFSNCEEPSYQNIIY